MRCLTINSGSSSLKAALYAMGSTETRLLAASVNWRWTSDFSEPASPPPPAEPVARQTFSEM